MKKAALRKAAAMAMASAMMLGTMGMPAAAEEDLYEAVMVIPTLGADPAGLQDVENAVNEITESEIGVHVTLYPIGLSSLNSQQNLMIATGDKLDLMMIFGPIDPLSGYVNSGAVLALDDLYAEYGADIERAEGIAMAGGYLDGKLYAVPSEEKQARSYGFFARTDMLEEMGIEIDEDAYYTIDDLTEIFAKYKETYGDGYYCIAGTGATTDFYSYFNMVDTLGSSSATGVLMGGGLDGDTTITNLYTSDEYAAYAQTMYEWAQAGYFASDASTNTDAGTTQVQSGYYLGGFSTTETDMQANLSRDDGYPVTKINLQAPLSQTTQYQTSMWAINANSENPEKAFQLLNLMYADNSLDQILTYGLEGVSYQVLEKGEKYDQAVIDYADGVDAASTPYNMPLHVYGDKNSISVYTPATLDVYAMTEELNNNIPEDRQSISLGYTFNTVDVASELTAVNAVINQYIGIIATGAQDPANVLPEFTAALESAGIDTLISANQTQFDAWLAENGK